MYWRKARTAKVGEMLLLPTHTTIAAEEVEGRLKKEGMEAERGSM